MRASGRSTLLTTRTTGRRASSALRSTKRVCGSGPSLASTSSSTPSTIVSPRSTSPPKSAWPGVSTMLIFTSPYGTAVFFARIVMPFSRSRSIESMTRSLTSWFSRNAPDCQSIASTSVVLPWSTCATIATFRRSVRRAVTNPTVGAAITRGGQREGDPMRLARAVSRTWLRRSVAACCALGVALLLVGPVAHGARRPGRRPSRRSPSRCSARARRRWIRRASASPRWSRPEA